MSDKKNVLIMVGSESDRERMAGALEVLDKGGVAYDFAVSSTHRDPEQTAQIAKDAAYGEVRWDTEVTNQRGESVAKYDVLTLVAKQRG